jgi:hypothetical protein
MGRRGMRQGACYLCLVDGDLTFEHVPPRKAYNAGRFTVEDAFARLSERPRPFHGPVRQGGIGEYTQCPGCNNRTGHWYGSEYVLWALRAVELLNRVSPNVREVTLTATQRYPLRFLKQAVAMIFTANSPEFTRRNRELAAFVLNRDQRYLPRPYDLYLTLVRGRYSRMSGIYSTLSFSERRMEILSEVAHPPFGLVLAIGTRFGDGLGCISHFGEFSYDRKADVSFRVRIGDTESPFPGDYRTPDELAATRAAAVSAP